MDDLDKMKLMYEESLRERYEKEKKHDIDSVCCFTDLIWIDGWPSSRYVCSNCGKYYNENCETVEDFISRIKTEESNLSWEELKYRNSYSEYLWFKKNEKF